MVVSSLGHMDATKLKKRTNWVRVLDDADFVDDHNGVKEGIEDAEGSLTGRRGGVSLLLGLLGLGGQVQLAGTATIDLKICAHKESNSTTHDC
jgi:hypothetical protein